MRSLLRNGVIEIPKTIEQAFERCRQLRHEIPRIERQLADPSRRAAWRGPSTFEEWRRRATQARVAFIEELRQTEAWLDGRRLEGALALLRESRIYWQRFKQEIDLDDDERCFIAKIDDYFKREDAAKAAV